MLFYLLLYFKLIKKYNEENDEGYFLEVDVHYLEKLHEVHNDLPFLPSDRKLKKSKCLWLIYVIKLKVLYT